MKTIFAVIMTALVGLGALCGCSAKAAQGAGGQEADSTKMLVCYFSATGTTAEAARRVASLTGADIYEITPAEVYTEADLDWRDSLSRSTVEMHTPSARPALKDSVAPDLSQYDIVLIGYPNWWNSHPMIINTFIESCDLAGKVIAPFMTSGGSDITNSEALLKASYPSLTFAKGLLMNSVNDDEIRQWVDSVSQ